MKISRKKSLTDITIYIVNRTISGEGIEETGVSEMLVMLINAAIKYKPKRHIEMKWIEEER